MTEDRGVYGRNTAQTADDPVVVGLRGYRETARNGADVHALETARAAILDALPPWAWETAADAGNGQLTDDRINELARQLRTGPDAEGLQAAQAIRRLIDDPADALDATDEHAPNPPPVTWAIKGWMPDATISVLSGAGGAGKSRIALQLAVAVADGSETWLDSGSGAARLTGLQAPAVQLQGPVVFAAWETRRVAFANRLAAICGQDSERAQRMERLKGRLHYVNMRPAGGLWGAAPREHTSTAGGWLAGGDALRRYVTRVDARLLIIDPVAAAFVQNENDRALVRAFLSALDQWAEDSGCAVLLISHPPKSEHAQSGSTDWRNGVQAVWTLGPAMVKQTPTEGGKARLTADPDVRCLAVDKLNEGRTPDPVYLAFEGGRFLEVQKPADQNGAGGETARRELGI